MTRCAYNGQRPGSATATTLLADALFRHGVMARPDRRGIDFADVTRALAQPVRKRRPPDGRVRHWYWVDERQRWLRVVTEADGETVHNAFWDRNFEP